MCLKGHAVNIEMEETSKYRNMQCKDTINSFDGGIWEEELKEVGGRRRAFELSSKQTRDWADEQNRD